MKKYILLFIIIVLPVISFAQDGANAKKPSVDSSKDKDSTSENKQDVIV